MIAQRIQSDDISVSGVFQSFYVVPDYQREYVWGSDEVEQLLNDIRDELAGEKPDDAPEYFIGSIVVCPGAEGMLELIDGQQRMTTLFVTLCAIRDRLRALQPGGTAGLDGMIAAVSVDASGVERFRHRLDLQYEDSGEVLKRIADGGPPCVATTRSIANIQNAYAVGMGFLAREFDDDPSRLRAFFGYLTNKVKLIRIQTESVAKALKIFETINDRGVGLNSMDLLKNLLFMKASRSDFDTLKNTWKKLQDTIYGMGEKPLRFLRYFIFSRYDVESLREDQIYDWLSEREELAGYASDPLGFARELVAAAQAYRNFMSGKDERGQANRFLENIRLLGGKTARQHLILLLAGRHLEPRLFDRLAAELENLFFCYVITRQPTRDFERGFAAWASTLRQVSNDADFETFVSRHFFTAKAELSDRFDDAMSRLSMTGLQKYRLRYVLGKLTQHVELAAHGETESTKRLARFTGADFEVEHIHPQTPGEAAVREFGSADPSIVQRLGNLVLVERSINGSLGNRPYSEKKHVYPKSQILLTRVLSEPHRVGKNTRIDGAVAEFEPFTVWTETEVRKRQEQLGRLARRVWDIPPRIFA